MIWWYSSLKGDNGLITKNSNTQDALIICKQDKEYRKFAMFRPFHKFVNYMLDTPKENRCFYEVIQGENYQKPYFDIDISNSEIDINTSLELIDELKKSILKDRRIKEDDILVFSSHGNDKLSYHVVIDNWCLPDYFSNKKYCENIINNTVSKYNKYIDNLVYKSIQQFRTFDSTKYGKDRYKILISHKIDLNKRFNYFDLLLRSLVTNTSSCRVLEYTEQIKKIYDSELGDISKEELEIVNNLDLIKNNSFEILDIKERLIILKRLKPTYCNNCKRIHENENPYLLFMKDCILFDCRRNVIKSKIWERTVVQVSIYKKDDFIKKFLGKK